MATEDKSFAELVAEAPAAPSEGTVSLVGALAKSSEHGKFVLILQDGSTVTLETSAVKGHVVLGSSLGRTIVRVEVDAGKVPAISPQPFPQVTVAAQDTQSGTVRDIQTGAVDHTGFHDIGTEPGVDAPITGPYLEQGFGTGQYDTSPLFDKPPISDAFPAQAGGIAPFALATPHQAPANIVRAMRSRAGPFPRRPFAPGPISPLVRNTGPFDYPETIGDFDVISSELDYYPGVTGPGDATGPIADYSPSWGPDDIFTTTYE